MKSDYRFKHIEPYCHRQGAYTSQACAPNNETQSCMQYQIWHLRRCKATTFCFLKQPASLSAQHRHTVLASINLAL